MSFSIFTMKSLFSWALKAQMPRKSPQPLQISGLFADFSGGAVQEDTAETTPEDKKPLLKQNSFEKSINEVRLLGRVGKDPVIYEGKKKPFILFPLATTSVNWDNERGEFNEMTEWHTIINYHPQKIESISRFLKKGDRVYVSGKLIYRTGLGTEKSPQIILHDFISMYS